ncbi:hypothetical protein GGR25_000423 [Kaistia hirudinis]|uniref:Tellurium resistance protein TerC n=1 Tax=Kaistia hirudinis TaxID=1293440 RepID=A0A840AJT4_9HYPH|nr:hypothetical protein [Kaistia hirudinis]MBB3929404.1 hypothetical protein [Kaistia hirudinis]
MPSIRFGKRSVRLPESRLLRIGIGGAFIAGGVFSFLPVLGIWMLPLGFIVLSHDFPRIRRIRRQWQVKLSRKWARLRGKAVTKPG